MVHNGNRLPLKKIKSLFTEEGMPRYYVGFEVEGVRSMDLAAGTTLVEYSVLVDWWDHEDLVLESTPSWIFRRCVTHTDRTTEKYKKARPKHSENELKKFRRTEYGLVQLFFDPDLNLFPFDKQQICIEMEFSSFQDNSVTDASSAIRGYDLRKKSRLRAFPAFLADDAPHWAYRQLKSYEVKSGEPPYATYPCVVGEARRFRTYTLSVSRGSVENEIYQLRILLTNNPKAYLLTHHLPYAISAIFITLLWASGTTATTGVAVSNTVFNVGYYLASNPTTTNNQVSLILCMHLVINEIFMFSFVAGAKFWKVFTAFCVVLSGLLTAYLRCEPAHLSCKPADFCCKPVRHEPTVQPHVDFKAVSEGIKRFEKREIEDLFDAVDSGIENYDHFMNPTRLDSHIAARVDSHRPPLPVPHAPPHVGERSGLLRP